MAKEKMAVYFQPETMRKIEQEYREDNCSSKTEFIEKAVLFSAAKNSPVYIPVLLAAYYGLRRSDVLGLKWSNIDFENKKIAIAHKVVEQKVNGKYQSVGHDKMKTQSSNRTLPLMPEVETALRELQKHQSEQRRLCRSSYIHKYDDYVCVDEMGKLLRPNYISTQFGKLLKANGLRHIRVRVLRHSCASLQLANGVPMKAIQEWLGHSTFEVTLPVPNSNTKPVAVHTDMNIHLTTILGDT